MALTNDGLPAGRGVAALHHIIRHAAVVGLAGAITGVLVGGLGGLGGLGGRLMMRVAAVLAPDQAVGMLTDNENVVGEITLGGTFALVFFVGVLGGAFGAIAYVISEPWLAWAGRWRGLVFGLGLLAVGSTRAFDPENLDFALIENERVIVAMLVALYVLFGLLLVLVHSVLDRLLPPVDADGSIVGYALIDAFGLLLLAPFVASFFVADVCGCDPPRLTGLFVIATAGATALLWFSHVSERITSRLVAVVVLGGYAALAARSSRAPTAQRATSAPFSEASLRRVGALSRAFRCSCRSSPRAVSPHPTRLHPRAPMRPAAAPGSRGCSGPSWSRSGSARASPSRREAVRRA